jgi:hypothetical protein
MRASLRAAVRDRYGGYCGYCGVHEDEVGAQMTIDHFIPRSRGGGNGEENLVYCCHACNEFKGDYWGDDNRQLLHPRDDDVSLHYVESVQHILVPLTERGHLHIEVLHLNRPQLIVRRRRIYRENDHADAVTELLRRFESLEAEVRRLRESV